jgi:hypothetical protein
VDRKRSHPLQTTTLDMLAARAPRAPSLSTDDDDAFVDVTESFASLDVADNVERAARAKRLASDDRLLDAARAWRATSTDAAATTSEVEVDTDDALASIVRTASDAERWIAQLKEPATSACGWLRQRSTLASSLALLSSNAAASNAKRARTRIYYKCETAQTLAVRIETVITRDLLVPLLSCLNESELYASWLPKWTTPTRLGVRESVKVDQVGRCSQLVVITCDCPWPLETRQVVLNAVAFDDIETLGDIGVLLQTRDCMDDDRVPPKPHDEDVTRIDVDGGFLFRRVPDGWANAEGEDPCADVGEDDILVSFGYTVDPKLEYIPNWLLNFIVRTVIGTLWGAFIQVAEDVRDGKRPEHASVIQEKRQTLYDWVDARVARMLARP